jgi:hypothetical protein
MSGFIISYTTFLNKEKNPLYNFKLFFIDRFSRIYFSLIPALAFIALADYGLYYFNGTVVSNADFKTFIANVLMLQDFTNMNRVQSVLENLFGIKFTFSLVTTSFGSGRPLWTVAIEWWIYMLFGWVTLFRKEKNQLIFWIGILCFLPVPFYNWIRNGRGFGLTFTWLLGSFAYIFISQIRLNLSKRDNITLISIFSLLAWSRFSFTQITYDPLYATLIAISFYFTVLYFQNYEHNFSKYFEKFITFGAGYSFTLYLTHYTTLNFTHKVIGKFENNLTSQVISDFIITNILAVLMYIMFEKNYRKFRSWLKLKVTNT